MFRRSASLAIPHRKSFAVIPSVSLVLLGHPQRFSVTGIAARNCPRLGTFETDALLPTRRNRGKIRAFVSQGLCVLTFRGPLASHDSNPFRIAANSHDTMPLRRKREREREREREKKQKRRPPVKGCREATNG